MSLHATLNSSATTNTNVGLTASDHGVFVNYVAIRGALYQGGQVYLLNDGATGDYNWDYFSDDVGMTLSGDVSGANIRLIAVVDNSVITNVELYYNLTKISL